MTILIPFQFHDGAMDTVVFLGGMVLLAVVIGAIAYRFFIALALNSDFIGLKAQDLVVTMGQQRLSEGAPVNVEIEE